MQLNDTDKQSTDVTSTEETREVAKAPAKLTPEWSEVEEDVTETPAGPAPVEVSADTKEAVDPGAAKASAEATAPAETKVPAEQIPFSHFKLEEPLNKAIRDLGYAYCTPIQAQSLRYTLVGYDVTGKAQTGTGKTAAFLITIINDLLKKPIQEQRYVGEPRAIVLAPTRELVMQIASDAANLCKHTDLHVVTLVGGEDYQRQLRSVDKKPVDIVVATPGRLIDFLQNEHLYLGLVEILVIDEADRMLDMGFIPQVRNIVSRTPHRDCRQTLLFSATFTPEIIELTSRWAMDPIMIEIEPEHVATDTVEQIVYLVTSEDKYKLLYNLVSLQGSEKVIVFSNRRDQVRKLADNLHRNGVNCGLLSGEIAQNKRVRTLEEFRDGRIAVLVATDVAGRGLHIDDVTHVINYTLPEEAEDYVHRIGRTGRAGATGTSISFACEEDSFLLPNIEEKLGQKLPCVYPDQRLLTDPPPFSRPSKFKDESKAAGSKSGGRSSGSGRPRPRR
jgi:ATP-dependent RNA helicase RhlB